jgi:Ca2+-transporting ATPase
MASHGLKVLAYAYKDYTREEYQNVLRSVPDDESTEFRQLNESGLTYICTFGMKDKNRENISNYVSMIRNGHLPDCEDTEGNFQVNIRMITGDHLDTARWVAHKTGIITHEEMQDDDVVMSSSEFRRRIGHYEQRIDPDTGDTRIQFLEKARFDTLKKRVKVIARCTSEDKFVFVCGIKQKGGLVGMTGSSISDAQALKKADVGLCMGSGCDVAKDNADLVILDNNFLSIHKSIQWGRTIFDNVRKFLQFQLTINIVICFVTILGGFTIGVAPLNVIQMLWANLIMDILGAIAIGTEPYIQGTSEVCSNRISRKDAIMNSVMWRQILCQCAYQILVMVILMYFGGMMFFKHSFNLIKEPNRDQEGNPTDRLVLNTICFHTFILMNWFNTINSRVLDQKEVNVFKTIHNNPFLWLVMGLELVVQCMMIKAGNSTLGSALLGTAPLTTPMHVACWCFGAFTLVVNFVSKLIPLSKFAFTEAVTLSEVDSFSKKTSNWASDSFRKVKENVDDDDGDQC